MALILFYMNGKLDTFYECDIIFTEQLLSFLLHFFSFLKSILA